MNTIFYNCDYTINTHLSNSSLVLVYPHCREPRKEAPVFPVFKPRLIDGWFFLFYKKSRTDVFTEKGKPNTKSKQSSPRSVSVFEQ